MVNLLKQMQCRNWRSYLPLQSHRESNWSSSKWNCTCQQWKKSMKNWIHIDFPWFFGVPKNPLRQISTNTAIFISNGRSPTSINHDDFPFKVNRKSWIIKAKNPNVCLGRIILVSIPSPPKWFLSLWLANLKRKVKQKLTCSHTGLLSSPISGKMTSLASFDEPRVRISSTNWTTQKNHQEDLIISESVIDETFCIGKNQCFTVYFFR